MDRKADHLPVIGTVITGNFVGRARLLLQSLQRYHPQARLHVLVLDTPESARMLEQEGAQLWTWPDLGEQEHLMWHLAFGGGCKGLSAAAKPFFLRKLLHQLQQPVLFLDPDMMLMGSLDGLMRAFPERGILLCPHRVTPSVAQGTTCTEQTLVCAGTFNAGLIGLAPDTRAEHVLSWWCSRVRYACRHAPEQGVYYDQRWLDLVPGLFEDVTVLRDPRYNVAWWNLDERADINDVRLFHASGYNPDSPERRSCHDTTETPLDPASVHPWFTAYHNALLSCLEGLQTPPAHPFSCWDNGQPIPDIIRDIYAELNCETTRFGNPFASATPHSFFSWLQQPLPEAPGLTQFWLGLWRLRRDLQTSFPDPLGRDRAAYLRWAALVGSQEYHLPAALQAPLVPDAEIACRVSRGCIGKPFDVTLKVFFPKGSPTQALFPCTVFFSGNTSNTEAPSADYLPCARLALGGRVAIYAERKKPAKKKDMRFVKATLRWICKHAPELGVDPHRIDEGTPR